MKKRNNDEFLIELKKANPNVVALETYINSSTKILFKCRVCGHEWKTIPYSLLHGHGCPICGREVANTKTRKSNEIFLKELGSILPTVVPCEEYKSALSYMKCRCKICGYEWTSKPNWLLAGHGCPICGHVSGGEKIRSNNDEFREKLSAVNSHITPMEEYVLSSKPIKCKCQVCGNEWKATPNNLLRGGGCPKCNRIFQTSFPEQALYYYVKKEFNDAINGYKLGTTEIDIYIPSMSVGIEYDGKHWHNGKHAVEKEKNKYILLSQNNIKLIRLKEEPVISDEQFCDILFTYSVERDGYDQLNRTIESILSFLGKQVSASVENDMYSIQEQYYSFKRGHSLALVYPIAVEEWYQEKNGNITPYMVHTGSTVKYWWRCNKCGYIWKTSPRSRVDNDFGCANCNGNAPKTNAQFLAELRLINDKITPLEEYKGSAVKILCRCEQCMHEWMITPSKLLNRRGCPQCYLKSKIKSQESFLSEVEQKNPSVEILSNYQGIRKPILCRCKKCGYEYQTTPLQVLKGKKCKKCCGTAKKTNEEFLQDLSTKNQLIEALDEYQGAHVKLRFRCKKCGWIWEAKPASILNNGTGCPNCYTLRSRRNNTP